MAEAAPLILVVDDEESYRDALTVALEREGFRVEVAADGQQAIDQFDATSPSLVLLDVMLPRHRGVLLPRRGLVLPGRGMLLPLCMCHGFSYQR